MLSRVATARHWSTVSRCASRPSRATDRRAPHGMASRTSTTSAASGTAQRSGHAPRPPVPSRRRTMPGTPAPAGPRCLSTSGVALHMLQQPLRTISS